MTSPATQFFIDHPKSAVIAATLAIVPFGLSLILPSTWGAYVLLVVPACLLVAIGLSTFALFKAHHVHRASGLAWTALIVSLLEGIYLASFFVGS